jgi:hypothetical protein
VEISTRAKKAVVGALLFLALGLAALSGISVHQGSAVSDVPAAYAGGGVPPWYGDPPPDPNAPTPTPTPTP